MKILLLSAYHAQSHQSWCRSLKIMFPEHEWVLLSLPGRYFNWRIRGNALSWSIEQADILSQHYDLVLATSMVDCATLSGLNPNLSHVKWIVYFHENQFSYPVSTKHDHIEPKMVSLYNALCAEKVLFNSKYNYTSFISGLSAFLDKMPDHVPESTVRIIENKSSVLPVPIDVPIDKAVENKKLTLSSEVPVLLWNHRWEYDKGPLQLLNVLYELKKRNYKFRLNLIGQQFRTTPKELLEIRKVFSNEIINEGYIKSIENYHEILKSSDIVLSTSLHDFQGLAVLEAVALGCVPIVPERLAYPEFFPIKYCYESNFDNLDIEATSMADKIIEHVNNREAADLNDINISDLNYTNMREKYSKVLFSD